jgi:magnesium-transporting ATPase (P-type)
MSNLIKAMNPGAPITNEAEATAAARSSAVAIFIGVVVGIVGLVWTLMNPEAMQQAVAQASADSPESAAVAEVAATAGLWFAGGLALVQLIFAVLQWRDPKKWIAILFIVLIALGILQTAATPMLAGMMPDAPVVPMWQIALSLVIMVIQVVLHVSGLRGINRLEAMQMDAAR